MRERILRLCKRLDKFTFEDISTIADDVQENVLKLMLTMLVQEKKLILKDDTYFYNREISKNKRNLRLPLFFQYHDKQTIEYIIKCFCADISVIKTALITEINRNTINNFYKYFSELLFKKQKNKLIKLYEAEPKTSSVRKLYNRNLYLYNYENRIYISDKLLQNANTESSYTKEEYKKICITSLRIKRAFKNYVVEPAFYETANEKLWHQDKTQEEKVRELKQLLNIS